MDERELVIKLKKLCVSKKKLIETIATSVRDEENLREEISSDWNKARHNDGLKILFNRKWGVRNSNFKIKQDRLFNAIVSSRKQIQSIEEDIYQLIQNF